MKKFYTFLFYFIFEYKFLISQNAIAGIFDIFKEPAEVCVDILKKNMICPSLTVEGNVKVFSRSISMYENIIER